MSQFLWVRNSGVNVGWFWLKVSHEVVPKMSARATVIGSLDCGSGLPFQSGSLLWPASHSQVLAGDTERSDRAWSHCW